MADDIEVSVVLPTLNEGSTIGICIDKINEIFEKQGIRGEIIVSDSSTDDTPKIAKDRGARVVRPHKKGYGNACIEGFRHARGSIYVMGDADNTYDFNEMPYFIGPLRRKEADLVLGNRFGREIKKYAMPRLHKYIGNPILTRTLNLLYKTSIKDAHCGMRAFTSDAWKKMSLNTGGMEFASEMVIKASANKLVIGEVPVSYYPRMGNPPKIHSFRDGWRHLRFMLLYKSDVVLLYPGIMLFLLGMIFTVVFYRGPLRIGDITLSIHPLILANMVAILGFQLLIFGLYSNIYNYLNNIRYDVIARKFINYYSLEREFLVGLSLFLVGFFIDLHILYTWINANFGELQLINNAIVASTLMILGLMIVFSSYFISVLLLNYDVVE